MGKVSLWSRASLAFASLAVWSGLSIAEADADPRSCEEAYPAGDHYANVRRSLKTGDCGCSRHFFTALGRQHYEQIEPERAFFDEINHEIFLCEVELGQDGLAEGDGPRERSVRGNAR